jgi:hypothetical protein
MRLAAPFNLSFICSFSTSLDWKETTTTLAAATYRIRD